MIDRRKVIDIIPSKTPYLTRYILECIECRKKFTTIKNNFNHGVGTFCSHKCSAENRWKTKTFRKPKNRKQVLTKDGYWKVFKKDHPFAMSDGYVHKHRLVLEKKLGYFLDPKVFDVHHIDGDKSNNKASNLEALSRSEHRKRHMPRFPTIVIEGTVFKKCSRCHIIKPIKYFYKKSRDSDRTFTRCSACCYVMGRKRLKEHNAPL